MSGPFKMKGYSYPGTSPLKQDKLTPEQIAEWNKHKENIIKTVPNAEAHFDTTSVGNYYHPDDSFAWRMMLGASDKEINVIHKMGEPGGERHGINPKKIEEELKRKREKE